MSSRRERVFLWPAFRGVFPRFLPAKRGQIEVCPMAAKIFNAPPVGEVSAIDIVAVAEKDAGDMMLAVIVGSAGIKIKIAA